MELNFRIKINLPRVVNTLYFRWILEFKNNDI
jgi:hypothetical protein